MSDDDDFMQASDEDYDFEYEDDEDEDTGDADVENKYYNAKQLKTTDPEDAVDDFLSISTLEKEKGEWGFKGLKQAIKLEFKLGRYEKVHTFTCFWDLGLRQLHVKADANDKFLGS
jgi:COP9 signalosome complex subunit 2